MNRSVAAAVGLLLTGCAVVHGRAAGPDNRDAGSPDAGMLEPADAGPPPLQVVRVAFIKSPFPDEGDGFGHRVVLSADGTALAIVGRDETDALGVVDEPNDRGPRSPSVDLLRRTDAGWVPEVFLKPSNTARERLGSVSLDASGDVVSLQFTALRSSHVVSVFARSPEGWTERATVPFSGVWEEPLTTYLLADGDALWVAGPPVRPEFPGRIRRWSGEEEWAPIDEASPSSLDYYGVFAASRSGEVIAVSDLSAPATDEMGQTVMNVGQVTTQTLGPGGWERPIVVPREAVATLQRRGTTLALSGDGRRLAVSVAGYAPGGPGVSHAPFDAGDAVSAVLVYRAEDRSWELEAVLKADAESPEAALGAAIAFDDDGTTLVVGAGEFLEDSDGPTRISGYAFVYRRTGALWSQAARLESPTPAPPRPVDSTFSGFASSVTLSGDGHWLAVGWPNDESGGAGVGAEPGAMPARPESGAVLVYRLD